MPNTTAAESGNFPKAIEAYQKVSAEYQYGLQKLAQSSSEQN